MILKASSGETAHLKTVPMKNICVSVAHISDIKTILQSTITKIYYIFLRIRSPIIHF